MTNAEAHAGELEAMLSKAELPADLLEAYVLEHSGLPGPRGNLELAEAVARVLGDAAGRPRVRALLERWLSLTSDVAPTGDAHEFLPFCALQAMARACAGDTDRRASTERHLRDAANDPRWRLREASAMGLQRIGERDRDAMLEILERWAVDATLLEERAIVAALAHPPILDEATARVAIGHGRRAVRRVEQADPATRRSEPFRVLSQGLAYAISVFAAALPGAGFELLEEVSRSEDRAVRRIIEANLGKARLAKRYPAEVAALLGNLRG